MSTLCDRCAIRTSCDWLSEICRLTPAEVVALRPDLIKPTRSVYLREYDDRRREEQIKRDEANPLGVFARRRLRRLRELELQGYI